MNIRRAREGWKAPEYELKPEDLSPASDVKLHLYSIRIRSINNNTRFDVTGIFIGRRLCIFAFQWSTSLWSCSSPTEQVQNISLKHYFIDIAY